MKQDGQSARCSYSSRCGRSLTPLTPVDAVGRTVVDASFNREFGRRPVLASATIAPEFDR